jgi:hypothetical protein
MIQAKLTFSGILGMLWVVANTIGTQAAPSELTAEQKSKVDSLISLMSELGRDPKVVAAVKAQNTQLPEVLKGVDETKWKELTVESPELIAVSKNELAGYLRGRIHHTVIELFINDAEGRKVTLFAKTTNWNHKGKAKHDVPMKGKFWNGPIEVDESTKQLQVQGSFPVFDGSKAIGSVVLGFWLPKL